MTKADFEAELRDRLSEETPVFWENPEYYINHAQRLVAAVTRGVSAQVSGTIDKDTHYISVPDDIIGIHDDGFYTSTGITLQVVPQRDLQRVMPNWRRQYGNPKWVTIDYTAKRAYAVPVGGTDAELVDETLALLLDEDANRLIFDESFTLTGHVAVLPTDVSDGTDTLFDDQRGMDKYLNATLNLATSIALLKERYDGDAERFYQFFTTELQALGVTPETIPDMQEATSVAVDN